MTKSDAIDQLAAALSAAQSQITNATRDSSNPQFRMRYADLTSVWEACRKALSDNGLSVIQAPQCDGAKITVTTMLCHSSGQWCASDLTLTAKRQVQGGGWEALDNPQSVGSAITYARRYALAAMVGVSPEDDDGEASEGRRAPISQPDTRYYAAREPAAQALRGTIAAVQPAPAPPSPAASIQEGVAGRPWTSYKGMLLAFQAIRDALSPYTSPYYDKLHKYGVQHANDFNAKKLSELREQEISAGEASMIAAQCYAELCDVVRDYEAAKSAPDAFDQHMAAEGETNGIIESVGH